MLINSNFASKTNVLSCPHCQPNINGENHKYFLFSHFFIIPTLFVLPLLYSSNQVESSLFGEPCLFCFVLFLWNNKKFYSNKLYNLLFWIVHTLEKHLGKEVDIIYQSGKLALNPWILDKVEVLNWKVRAPTLESCIE